MNANSFEINLAQSIIRRFALSPPIDVAKVAEHYAVVEYRQIPLRVDGICLNLKRPGTRPTIIINSERPRRCIRFTLAHELGHVLIPWHQGSLYDLSDRDDEFDRLEMEAEANRFATELLMPRRWISECLRVTNDFGAAISLVQDKADVSTIASAIRVVGFASPGHIFAYLDENGTVLNSGRSPGTFSDAPTWNTWLDRAHLDRNASDWGEVLAGPTCLYWWKLPDTVPLEQPDDSRSWRDILEDILVDLGEPSTNKHKARQSINGVIGATNSRKRGSTSEELLAALIQRFNGKAIEGDVYAEFSLHAKFHDFLVQRVIALRDTNA